MSTEAGRGASPGTGRDTLVTSPKGIAGIALSRTRVELLEFFREREAVVFIFAFPVVMLLIFSSVFGSGHDFIKIGDTGISAAQYYLTGMVATGVMQTSFQSLAITIAVERDSGQLKLLRGTPMPPLAYFLGKIGQVVVTTVIQLVILLAVARLAFGVALPSDAGRWVRLAYLVVIGAAAGTALGIAFSSVPKSGRSAPTVVTPVVLILQFISGVYFTYGQLPSWMHAIASVFPLKWMAQGMRSVFLPEGMVRAEPGHSWQLGTGAVVMTVWLVVGLFLAVRTFRWVRERHA
jgi:ABC-2 type transport system permease protein